MYGKSYGQNKVMKMYGYNGKSIFFRSGNSTFAPSDWFMQAWSHILTM